MKTKSQLSNWLLLLSYYPFCTSTQASRSSSHVLSVISKTLGSELWAFHVLLPVHVSHINNCYQFIRASHPLNATWGASRWHDQVFHCVNESTQPFQHDRGSLTQCSRLCYFYVWGRTCINNYLRTLAWHMQTNF